MRAQLTPRVAVRGTVMGSDSPRRDIPTIAEGTVWT